MPHPKQKYFYSQELLLYNTRNNKSLKTRQKAMRNDKTLENSSKIYEETKKSDNVFKNLAKS